MEEAKNYFAFISYQRKDEEWAEKLRNKLEHYRLPSNVLKQDVSLPKEIRPIFRDALELAGGVLAKEIEMALQSSKFLIVICSPNSAKSPWVNKEIQTFIDLGREDRIIPFIIEGIPFSDNEETECFPPTLRALKGEKELLGININELSRDAAAVKVVARMFGLKFDTLWQRYEREQKRKRWAMIIGALLTVLLSIGIVSFIYRQNALLREKDKEMSEQNKKLDDNAREMVRQNAELKEKEWRMMENQARSVAEHACNEIQIGNLYESILALLEITPLNDERPFVPELERALRIAYDSLQTMNWTYRLIDGQVDEAYMSNKERYIVVCKNPHVYIYDYNTLDTCTTIELPSSVDKVAYRTYLSDDESKLYVAETTGVICYSIPSGQFIGRIKLNDYKRGKEIVHELYRSGKDCNTSDPFAAIHGSGTPVNKWATSLFGLQSEYEILDYCHASRMAVYRKDFNKIVLYNCSTKQEVQELSFPDSIFETIGEYSDCTFSKDGKKLALSHTINGSMVFDIENSTAKFFDCNECYHYTNWFRFSNSNKFLHSSRTISRLDIIDDSSFKVVDSIVPPRETYVWDAYLNKAGDKCLLMADNELYLYYKHLQKPSTSKINRAGFVKLGEPMCKKDTIINNRFHLTITDEGINCVDLNGEFGGWNHTYLYGSDIVGYAHHNQYLIVEDHNRALSTLCILDLTSGIEVFRENELKCGLYHYYNPRTEQFIFEKYDSSFYVYDFLPINDVVSNLKKITAGLKLNNRERDEFFLEKLIN